ncbi:hypothetical protein HPT25_11370 [Bacillus sp. BRMEA1]|uniref:hypothetical protein n=1 Tax=Neobacillus endophyticus TaxID=2738405 RepID=UPI001567A340|nr:hypothetical protein [Neobacillus endophyticus]NRD77984.1 hypothetical protein [Neobacillus endophyticus]
MRDYSQQTLPAVEKSTKFQVLLDEVREKQLQPEDQFEIAALLESMGWNDSRAEKEFGVKDLFELADHLWESIESNLNYQAFTKAQQPKGVLKRIEMIRSFLRGLIFAFPMGVSVAAMLTLKFSLWSYKYLSLKNATSIAIGTILSFVVVGGFTQAIARRGFFYIIQGYYNLARRTTFLFILIGFGVCIGISLILIALNVIFNMFSYDMILLIILFFFFLTAIWLSVTVMYILKKEIIFTGLIIFGIFLVYIMFDRFHIDIILSQLISLLIVSLCSILLVLYFFLKAERKGEKGIAIKLPRFSITLYTIWPYFFYGFLYFSFLFIDRVNAWTKNEDYMPYMILFRGQYELGLDFALLTIILPMGISEVILSKLMSDIELSQKNFLISESDKLYKKFVRSYKKLAGMIFASSVISSIVIYRFLLWYNQTSIRLNGENLLNNHVTLFVLLWGIISYIMLAFCLMNAVILFALSQANMVVKALMPSILCNFIIGFLLSRWISYEYAVIGLLAGTILLTVLTTQALMKVLKNLDFYLYAAS